MDRYKTIDDEIGADDPVLTQNMKLHLTETRKWAILFAVMGVLFSLLMLVAMVAIISAGSAIDNNAGMPISSTAIAALYLVLAAVYGFPVYALFKFNTKARIAVSTDSMDSFEDSLKYMKLLFRGMGILTLAVIVLYGVAIMVVVAQRM